MRCNNIDIRFASETDSMNAFTQLKEMGVKCYHTGKNAPNGASVMMYSCDRNILTFKFNHEERENKSLPFYKQRQI